MLSRVAVCRFAAARLRQTNVRSLCGTTESARSPRFGFLGICDDRGSSYAQGAALAPPAIRAALSNDSSNAFSERGTRVSLNDDVVDFGDLIEPEDEEIHAKLGKVMDNGLFPMILGGDHAITRPVVSALHAHRQNNKANQDRKLVVIQFDAHSDLYDELDTPFRKVNAPELSHATQMTHIMKHSLCDALVQVGVRCNTPDNRHNIDRLGVDCLEMQNLHFDGREIAGQIHYALTKRFGTEHFAAFTDIYISFDIDVIEPGLAPGVSHIEPGGMLVRQCIDTLAHLECGTLVAADIVELNPPRDIGDGLTARVAAKIVKELLSSVPH